MGKAKELTGQRFGRLVVMSRTDSYISADRATYIPRFVCHCDCGNETVVMRHNLISGRTLSCGCIRRERASARMVNKYAEK